MEYEWAFAFVLLEYAFLIAHFGVFSLIALQNMHFGAVRPTPEAAALLLATDWAGAEFVVL